MTKKFLLIAVCIIMMSMTANAISINKALLDHNGTVTLYDGLQDAINASADGDVIYLTLGTFKGPITISKKITIRGTGETSIIDGDVSISISGTAELTNPILEALTVSGSVTVSSSMSNLYMHKCKINGTLAINSNINGGKIEKCKVGSITFGGTIDNYYIDRSYITSTLTISSGIKGMTVVNTKLYNLKANSGATGNTTFVNCNILFLYAPNFSGTIINSIIGYSTNSSGGSGSSSNNSILSTVLLNTLMYSYDNSVKIGSSSVSQNCYKQSSYISNSLLTNLCECAYTTSQLQTNGYLGTDGTVVGIYGGEPPYSETDMLTPAVPKVTSSSLDLDMEKKELNVKLTVSPQ